MIRNARSKSSAGSILSLLLLRHRRITPSRWAPSGTLQPDQQNADVGGRNTRNSGGLPNSRRSNRSQLLTRFRPQTGDKSVVESQRDLFLLKTFHLGHLILLPHNITGVFNGDLDLLGFYDR